MTVYNFSVFLSLIFLFTVHETDMQKPKLSNYANHCKPNNGKESLLGRFEDIWKFKDNDDPHERYYKDVIERDKMVKIEQEIRNIVDDLMRSELELLQAAFDKDRAFKGKKGKKPQKVSAQKFCI